MEETGFRSQDSGGGRARAGDKRNCEWWIAFFLLRRRRLPTPFEVPQVRRAGPALPLLSAHRVRTEFESTARFACRASCDTKSRTTGKERAS